ncbi:hypothetical protein Pla175_08360 [Pirellulimonas nuda]|uniref:DUF488 domain-containing protein n=1 Tax=Pirellulimonas nuda TaxID=2528009 RepID=A0A518D7L3_9BACT|nr:DUF488 domain-containing protein [Pirellulimonas nuda]QDU87474.1 hypothetical protein Pla175_08360 [Pirellulimonas nuda]
MTNLQFAIRSHVLTIGHSRHSMERFLELLQAHQVTAIADVRSTPHSRTDHFCQAPLRIALEQAGVRYAYLGQELGARRDEPECYVDGQAVYDRVARLPAFAAGVERLRRGAQRFRIALMCAEKEPLDCHRSVLIARYLALAGWRVEHILADGSLEPHAETDRRLVGMMGIERSLFEPQQGWDDLVAQAYSARACELAYRPV